MPDGAGSPSQIASAAFAPPNAMSAQNSRQARVAEGGQLFLPGRVEHL